MRVVITGCAGFIGSNLVDKLLDLGYDVVGIDNFSTGKIEFLNNAIKQCNFYLFELDLLRDKKYLVKVFRNADYIFHLAANADIKNNVNEPEKNLQQNIIATFNVLEAAKKEKVKNIVFSSTGSVYGETSLVPTPEKTYLYPQTSIYSASKLAGESLIEAYCESFDMRGFIFRFVSVLGPRYHHGHIYDFYKQLEDNPNYLKVLGNGTQTKSYLHVYDCIDGMLTGIRFPMKKVNIYNLGNNETIKVRESVKEIINFLQLNPVIDYGTEPRGWVGDNPLIYLDCTEIRKLGWTPKYSIRHAIIDTLNYLKGEDEKNINNNWR